MSDPDPLVKTTVYLAGSAYRRLQALARARRRPAAELVREAVSEYAAREARGPRPRSIAAGRSGRRDLSERAEELLAGLGRR
jgi:predicted transcriptional regulator